ncbi:hypothetical protein B6U90_03815 [Thermoplasmatales archaeon ex4484_6]|nr:MAG: hypothetical protein B6U90_03815 [Thermoplasmatales archaeon ex4484_6]
MSPVGRKKNYKVRTGARTASKGLEKELKRKARRLAQDPTLALPRCTVDVPLFRNLEKKLRDIQSRKDSRSYLEKAAKSGDKLARAYAGALLLNHEDKIQYLAVMRTPFGDVGYALRGSTTKEKLAGIQNYDNPRIKMMAFLEEVKKKKLFMFVTDNEVICTGKDPKPPKEVLDPLPKRLGKGMKRVGNTIISPDLEPGIVSKRLPFREPYLVVRWEPAELDMARSLTHSRQNEDNIFATCASYMATDRISSYFSVDVIVKPMCTRGSSCPCNPPPKKEKREGFLERLGKVKEPTNIENYLEGKMMDHRLIEKERSAYEERLKEVGKTVYIIENRCYGDSSDDMLEHIRTKGREKEIMKRFLELAEGPIISDDPSPNRIMAPFWSKVGEELIHDIVKDRKIASSVFREFPVPRYQPLTVIEEAGYLLEEKRIRSLLPRPKDPPEMIEFAYECAVAYLVRGEPGASKVLSSYPGDDIKLKAAKYAFVKHLDLAKTSGWSYTTHEVGYAQGMDRIVEKIIVEDPERFKNGLRELWKATGSTMDLEFE